MGRAGCGQGVGAGQGSGCSSGLSHPVTSAVAAGSRCLLSAREDAINTSRPDCFLTCFAFPYLKWNLHIHGLLNRFLLFRDVEMDKM